MKNLRTSYYAAMARQDRMKKSRTRDGDFDDMGSRETEMRYRYAQKMRQGRF
jgi:hypothetical protein